MLQYDYDEDPRILREAERAASHADEMQAEFGGRPGDAERAKAQRRREQVEESWERSDTDGFLSQWAGSISARKHDMQAKIDDNGGTWEFPGLYEIETGRRLNARIVDGKYGRVWLLSDSETVRFGRRFIPLSLVTSGVPIVQTGTRQSTGSKVQRDLGLEQRFEQGAAVAVIEGSGTGLSGMAWVTVKRIDEYGTKFNKADL